MPRTTADDAIDRLLASPALSPAFKRGLVKGSLEAQLAAANAIIAEQSAVIATAHAAISRYLRVFDRCGGSEAVSADEFATARERLRRAIVRIEGATK